MPWDKNHCTMAEKEMAKSVPKNIRIAHNKNNFIANSGYI